MMATRADNNFIITTLEWIKRLLKFDLNKSNSQYVGGFELPELYIHDPDDHAGQYLSSPCLLNFLAKNQNVPMLKHSVGGENGIEDDRISVTSIGWLMTLRSEDSTDSNGEMVPVKISQLLMIEEIDENNNITSLPNFGLIDAGIDLWNMGDLLSYNNFTNHRIFKQQSTNYHNIIETNYRDIPDSDGSNLTLLDFEYQKPLTKHAFFSRSDLLMMRALLIQRYVDTGESNNLNYLFSGYKLHTGRAASDIVMNELEQFGENAPYYDPEDASDQVDANDMAEWFSLKAELISQEDKDPLAEQASELGLSSRKSRNFRSTNSQKQKVKNSVGSVQTDSIKIGPCDNIQKGRVAAMFFSIPCPPTWIFIKEIAQEVTSGSNQYDTGELFHKICEDVNSDNFNDASVLIRGYKIGWKIT